MTASEIIKIKRDGAELPAEAIRDFVRSAAYGGWEESQLSALLMAIFLRGMTTQETALLTREMTITGDQIDLSDINGPKVDKHSTGGVGDKTSLILAPLAAACGVVVPMVSGRGLGHTGGTLDKLESIPGYRVSLTVEEFKQCLRENNFAMMGQTQNVAPADKKLYALRDVTGTVESVPLITASILCKKIAEGISGLVLDVKVGRGAFMKTLDTARELAQSLVRVAKLNGLQCSALLTNMNEPLGKAVGNSLEVIECIETLKGNGPKDLEFLSVKLAARMVKFAGLAENDRKAEVLVRKNLENGNGLERFRANVKAQGGDPNILEDFSGFPQVPNLAFVNAARSGYISHVDAEAVGLAAMSLGAGRQKSSDQIDHAVGIIVHAKVGNYIHRNDPIFEIRYRNEYTKSLAMQRLMSCYSLTDETPLNQQAILEEVNS